MPAPFRRIGPAVAALLAVSALPAAAAGPSAGERLRWGRIALVASAPMDSAAWRDALDLEGRPLDEAPLEAAIRRGLRALAARGYPFAVARPRGFDLDGDRVSGRIEVDPGVRPRIAGITLDGAKVTRTATALRISGLEPGRVYTSREDRAVRERLSRSGLFSSVGEVTLLPGMEEDAVLLRVPVTEPPYTRFRGVLGVSGRESRLTGLVDLDLANIAGTARAAAGRWENRGEGLSRFALHYREPWLPLIPIGVRGDLAHDVNKDVYSYTRWEVTGDVTMAGQWTIRAGKGGARAVRAGTGAGNESEGYLVAGLEWERRNSTLNPTAGYRLFLESRRGTKTFLPAGDSLEVRVDRTRWNVGGEGYRRVGRQWLGVLKLRFDYLETPEHSIPRWDLFAVGGALSLRGYREEQFLTPAVWTVQTEWRWLQGGLGSALYLFADAAFLAPGEGRRLADTFRTFLLGTGIGVRQGSPLGILGVEYGIAKGESPLDGRIHLRIDAVF
jgi:outer membrane protein assembly factor BamA